MAEPSWYTAANRARLGVRRDMADALDDWASALAGTSGETGQHQEMAGLHADTSRKLTDVLNGGLGLPPTAAAGAAELLGYANEGVTGALQGILAASDVAKDRPVTHAIVSPAGWDPADVEENRVGQMQAIASGDKRPEWMRVAGAMQGAASRFAPGLVPYGVLETASREAPRMAELGLRALDAGGDIAAGLRNLWSRR